MSAPYPQQSNTDGGRRSFELKEVLAMVAAGAGVVGYLLGFFDDGVGALMGSMAGFGLICSAALAGLRFVPKTPDALFVSVPLSAYAALALLQDVVRNTASGLVAVLMVLALAQLAAVVGVLLIEGGVIKSGPTSSQPKPYGQPPFPQGQRGPGGPGGPGAARPGPGGPPAPGWSPQGQPGAQFGGPPPWNPAGGQPAQQPSGNRNPSSDGFATPNPDSSGPHQRPASQSGPIPQPGPQQPSQSGQQQPKTDSDGGGPQGTRQMPHPGANPPAF
ncbi:DUF5336 domain-containing protein [Saccharopolyspora mangrovi]|uniref:DUF5336 domain-containing protein n=1 Tax=Saccharopolyspora mangrovi TaxID=3082379 RepID=A0ABU6ABM2_9PSEU|nr:DUF5336 domain-containing protein [Saccharopolyspora sp. S2-29]MEB3368867.1 DUF5336 domain-containing protein [Saccharopolyspora sp. S2-29]